MTNNIVAQFACSLNANGTFKEYPVVNGSVFSEEYNETLDSATIILSQVKNEDRLATIEAYQYVRVYDKSGNTGLDVVYLVDNFDEKENNIKEHIFGYTINLMSETKWLEKFQCPNLAITHKIIDGVIQKKTIYDKIKEYGELYIPKVKMSTIGQLWGYQPLISIPDRYRTVTGTYTIPGTLFTVSGTDYVVDVNINIPDGLDVDTVIDIAYSAVGSPALTNQSLTKDTANNKLLFHGELSNMVGQPGFDITVLSWKLAYSYKIETDFYMKFKAPCADMGFSAPTLRQLFTTLMQQVGCIPIIKNRVLGYLDFQKDAVPFGNGDYSIGNTVNFIRRSLSSDSYVNTLVNISDNVLDSGNQVICESLGFRDRNKVLLKQEENLFLETKFPIYKILHCSLNAYVNVKLDIDNIQSENFSVAIPGTSPIVTITWDLKITKPSSGKVKLELQLGGVNGVSGWLLKVDGELVSTKYNNSNSPQVEDINENIIAEDFTPGTSDVFEFDLDDNSYDTFFFQGQFTVKNTATTADDYSYDIFFSTFEGTDKEMLTLYNQSITPLIVEKSVREQLSTDFSQMISDTSGTGPFTLDILAKYVYGTIGYSIGSNVISGFSDTYRVGSSTVLGWIEAGYTYIENIWNFITENYQNAIVLNLQEALGGFREVKNYSYRNGDIVGGGNESNYTIKSTTPYNPIKLESPVPGVERIFTSNINFAYLWFDIEYQPLNSFNLAYVKSIEDVDIPIAQYDGNASGLTDFDRLSIHEQEQVDRVGNETLTISQRATSFNQIQTFANGPLSFKDDTDRDGDTDSNDRGINYIIFKRSFTINNNCFNVSYTGSKDAVLKNYFTSIRTKYRAYQYVDYSQSTLRKERDTIFVKISENGWFNGDDKILFGDFSLDQGNKQKELMKKLLFGKNSIYQSVKNTLLQTGNQKAKNDVSIITTKNMIGLIYEESDNVGLGTYIAGDAFEQAYDNRSLMVGGVPQTWHIWADAYNEKHIVSFVTKFNMSSIFDTYMDASQEAAEDIYDDLKNVLLLPTLNQTFESSVVFSVCDKNDTYGSYDRTFYKDYAERINHTVQFIYYTDSENILWNEEFLTASRLGTDENVGSNCCLVDLTGKEFKIEAEQYESTENLDWWNGQITLSRVNSGNPCITIDWASDKLPTNCNQFKLVSKTMGTGSTRIYKDIVAFRKGTGSSQRFYVSLNDTKTDYVLSVKNGILYRRYKVGLFSSSRTVTNLYDE